VHDRLEGKMGLVTDAVPAGGELTGEVMIEGQAYYALPADHMEAIPKGTRVVVVDHTLHRTVVVTPM
jgi:membrane protein implicated in regulation of membrane protease activity